MSVKSVRTRWFAAFAAASCLTAVVAVPADAGTPEAPLAAAQPEIGDILERAIPPGARQLLAGIRVIDAWNARNRVYREARGVQRDLRAHYGAMLATADRFGAESGDTERYERVQQMLRAEQDVALSLTEDEKRDAKFGFESKLRRELTTALLQVPTVREGLGSLRDSIGDIRSTVEGVRSVVENGNPLAAVINEANERIAKLNEVAAYAQAIGGRPGRQLARLGQRLNGLVDQLERPTEGTLGAIDDLLGRLDDLATQVDDQLDKGRWIRTGVAARQVRDLLEQEAIEEVIDRISGGGDGGSTVLNAMSNAIVRERVGRDDLPPLSDDELRSMRDRVEAALLGRSAERVAGLCGRLSDELRRTGSGSATTRCELFGQPERLDEVLDAIRAGTSTTTTIADSETGDPDPTALPETSTTAAPTTTTTTPPPPPTPPPTQPPTTTTTAPPAPPRVVATVTVSEAISGGTVDAFTTTIEVVADLATGSFTFSAGGGGSSNRTYPCDDGANVIDEQVLRQSATAAAGGGGSVAIGGGAFEAAYEVTGSTNFTISQPYDDERCTQLNSGYPTESPYTGSGTISGTVQADGTVTVQTNWSAGGAQVTGSGSAVGQVTAGG